MYSLIIFTNNCNFEVKSKRKIKQISLREQLGQKVMPLKKWAVLTEVRAVLKRQNGQFKTFTCGILQNFRKEYV